MNDITSPDRAADSFARSASTAGQAGADAVRQMLDRNQTIANAWNSLGAETASFVSRRVEDGSETFGAIAQCRSVPELLELEVQWWRRAVDDYTGHMNRMAAYNAKLLGCFAEAPAAGEAKLPAPSTGGAPTKLQAA